MPRKTTILIVILALITGVLIFLAVRSDQGQQLLNTDATPTPTTIQPYASISFANGVVNASSGPTTQSVDIIIDTLDRPVAGAQLELSYDPAVLSNVTVKTPSTSFFGTNPSVLINAVDPSQGRISYAVGISASESEKMGRGNVATITFTVNRQAGVASTSLTFLPKSAVTTLSAPESVLSSANPLQIQILPATQ